MVDFFIENDHTSINAFTIYFSADDDKIQYIRCASGSLNPGWEMFDCSEYAPGEFIMAAFHASNAIPRGNHGTILKLFFEVTCSSCVSGDTCDLTITNVADDLSGFNTQNGIFTFQTENTPTPTCVNHGDVNFDDLITAGDAQLTFLIALGAHSPSVEEECAADCNADGDVTAADAQGVFIPALGMGTCADPL